MEEGGEQIIAPSKSATILHMSRFDKCYKDGKRVRQVEHNIEARLPSAEREIKISVRPHRTNIPVRSRSPVDWHHPRRLHFRTLPLHIRARRQREFWWFDTEGHKVWKDQPYVPTYNDVLIINQGFCCLTRLQLWQQMEQKFTVNSFPHPSS